MPRTTHQTLNLGFPNTQSIAIAASGMLVLLCFLQNSPYYKLNAFKFVDFQEDCCNQNLFLTSPKLFLTPRHLIQILQPLQVAPTSGFSSCPAVHKSWLSFVLPSF